MSVNTKYFKWKEFKDELYTHQLLNSSANFNREENKTDEQILNENQASTLVHPLNLILSLYIPLLTS